MMIMVKNHWENIKSIEQAVQILREEYSEELGEVLESLISEKCIQCEEDKCECCEICNHCVQTEELEEQISIYQTEIDNLLEEVKGFKEAANSLEDELSLYESKIHDFSEVINKL